MLKMIVDVKELLNVSQNIARNLKDVNGSRPLVVR